MPDQDRQQAKATKDRIGAFIHHPVTSLVVVVAILLSVSLVMLHLLLAPDSPHQHPIEQAQIALTVFFFAELGTKFYVAPDKARFFGQYWVDIIAILPWTQSLRVLRVLRLLRVFRVAIILSRRVRFVSALFRSAVGEYLVLGLIMLTLLVVGSFVLYVSESRARTRRDHQQLLVCDKALDALEARAEGRDAGPHGTGGGIRSAPDASELQTRAKAFAVRLGDVSAVDSRLVLSERERRAALDEIDEILAGIPPPRTLPGDEPAEGDLAEFENSFWATLYFLVATEPMIAPPSTTVGRIVVLAVMFGGLTTFAIFTGVVTALMVNRLKRRMEIDDMDRFQLNNHLLICGWNRLVPLIIREITSSPSGEDSAIVVIADLEEPPAEIASLKAGVSVYFVRGDYTKPELLENARVKHARLAIIVADTTQQRGDQDRDARTVLAALMIERMCPGIYTVAELLNRDNEPHLRAAGIEEVIVTSEVGGHHLAMAALHSGITEVFSELLDNKVGKNLSKVPVESTQIGKTYAEVLNARKAQRDDLVIGLEIKGQDGPRTEGYSMLVNPKGSVTLGERDNLIVIASPDRKSS
jgi:voltage-gated potassium channel